MRLVLTALVVFAAAAVAQQLPTTFIHNDSSATSVAIVGEFTKSDGLPMSRAGAGQWARTVMLPPGYYGYRFLINGKDFTLDARTPARKTVDGVECSAISVGNGKPAPPPVKPTVNGEPTFRFNGPNAQAVFVAGEFNQWSNTANPMQKDAAGVWTATLALKPGRYQYKFIVDGQWTQDTNNPEKADDTFGGFNSVLIVGGSATPAAPPVPASGSIRLGAVEIRPGQRNEFEVPLPKEIWTEAMRLPRPSADAVLPPEPKANVVHVGLCVPAGFDPGKSYPLLVISSTLNFSCVEHLGLYYAHAAEVGWVTLAADAPEIPAKQPDDSNAYRWAMINTALQYLHAQWPASKNWPVAAGGFSGGGARSGYVGALLAKSGYKLIGMWMGGINRDCASWGLHLYHPPQTKFERTPIYYSHGNKDPICTPAMAEQGFHEFKQNGYRRVRDVTYDGAHDPSPEHIKLGLKWFVEEAKD
jgi:hypothetical protein